jgi:hypothetical protein
LVKKEKMRTKNKMIASLEIAVVLCSVFLVAIPGLAAQDRNQVLIPLTVVNLPLNFSSNGEKIFQIF